MLLDNTKIEKGQDKGKGNKDKDIDFKDFSSKIRKIQKKCCFI